MFPPQFENAKKAPIKIKKENPKKARKSGSKAF
jgi:hypothetical protein